MYKSIKTDIEKTPSYGRITAIGWCFYVRVITDTSVNVKKTAVSVMQLKREHMMNNF